MKLVGRSYGITDDKLKKNRKGSHHPVGTDNFIAIDGEGINLPNGEHRYVLLAIGNEQIEDRNGLDWTTILDFLYSRFRINHTYGAIRTAYVGFFLSYDFDRWLRTMPEERAARLLTSEGRESRKSKSPKLHSKVLPVDMPNGWQINMLGKKFFEFRKRSCHCDNHYCKCPGKGPWMRICDAGSFFQSTLLNAIDPSVWKEPVVTNAEYELIKKGKSGRDDIIDISIPGEYEKWLSETKIYNALENAILVRLMNRVDSGFRKMGIVLAPGQWFGPGQAAEKWLKNECATKAEDVQNSVPQWFLEAARMSYFGGWFEIMMHGKIPGKTHAYDINSAYPYIIKSLPCLLHGQYEHGDGRPKKNTGYILVLASVSSGPSQIGAMLHREDDSSVKRPCNTIGWYWLHELKAAQKAGLIKECHYMKWMSYDPCDCLPPMRNVQFLYDYRLEIGKKTPHGKGARLAYNSMYGKFAQSVGNPRFANSIWSSLITAGCRTMILNAIATHPKGKDDVCMVATDAVFFCTPHPYLPISERLGDWDYESRDNLTLFKPGVYWDDKTRRDIDKKRNPRFKARGFSAADFAGQIREVDRAFERWNSVDNELPNDSLVVQDKWPYVEFKIGFSMVSCLQAIRRNKWELAGHVEQSATMTQDSNPESKRIPQAILSQLEDGREVWRTIPYRNGIDAWSMPYLKRFGMDDPNSLERQEEYGITPDGTVPDIIYNHLGIG